MGSRANGRLLPPFSRTPLDLKAAPIIEEGKIRRQNGELHKLLRSLRYFDFPISDGCWESGFSKLTLDSVHLNLKDVYRPVRHQMALLSFETNFPSVRTKLLSNDS